VGTEVERYDEVAEGANRHERLAGLRPHHLQVAARGYWYRETRSDARSSRVGFFAIEFPSRGQRLTQ
jgi:hypothetical protein